MSSSTTTSPFHLPERGRVPVAVASRDSGVEIASAPRTFDKGRFYDVLLRATNSASSERDARRSIRNAILLIPDTVGVGHAYLASDAWTISDTDSSGEGLDLPEVAKQVASLCETANRRKSIVQVHHDGATGKLTISAVPIQSFGRQPEALVVLSKSGGEGILLRRALEHAVSVFQLWKQNQEALTNDWKIASLAAIIDITDRIESASDFGLASQIVVNELSNYVGCANIALGWMRHGEISVVSVTGESAPSDRSETMRRIQQVQQEAILRAKPGRWSIKHTESDAPLLMMHRSLAHHLEVECVLSWPIKTPSEQTIGCWLFAGDAAQLENERLARLLEIASPRIGTALELVRQRPSGRIRKATGLLWKNARSSTMLVIFSVLGLLTLALFQHHPYQIRAQVEAMPEWRRFAVAPFEGQIEQAFVRVGDVVKEGDILVRLDGKQLRWQLLSIQAEKEHAARRREVEIAGRNTAEAMLAELDISRFEAEEAVIMHKLNQLEIRSPFDGIVLSGSSERAESASVVIGQPLFEIGSLHPIMLELSVPADDAVEIAPRQPVRIWMDGHSSSPLKAEIDLLRPVSEERLSQNVFIAEVKIGNESGALRPGMAGVAKIECDSHPLWWNLFHKPWNFLRSRLVW